MSVNEVAAQDVWQHYLLPPVGCGGLGGCTTQVLTELVRRAKLTGFDQNDKFFTTSCDPIWVSLSDFLTYFASGRTQSKFFLGKCLT
jgi:hypothetical protein